MKKYIFLSTVLLLFTASCSNDENNNETKEPTQAVQFSFTNEDFGEDETLTRTAETAKPQIVDLGDCEAEITVESEPAAKTRGAKMPANGHYTIRAYQSGTLKGEMSGTFSGSTFTPDASSPKDIVISAGTYDFIAFNDDVIPSGTGLTVARDKAETARMGFATQVITATPHKQQVNFTMKHVGARLRIKLICQKHFPEPLKAFVHNVDDNNLGVNTIYDPATKSYIKGSHTGTTLATITFPVSTEPLYSASNYGENYSYTSENTTYQYILPGATGSKLRLQFTGGTLFWKSLAGSGASNPFTPVSNASYKLTLKMKPKYTYLFSDGTTGFLSSPENATKKAVGLVVKPGLAISLYTCASFGPWNQSAPAGFHNPEHYKDRFADAYQTADGYELTWDGAHTLLPAGTVKATAIGAYSLPMFDFFYSAAHYDEQVLAPAGITATGTLVGKKWFMPSMGELKEAVKTLGFFDETSVSAYFDPYALTPVPNSSGYWYDNLVTSAFKAAGATESPFGILCTATEYDENFVVALKCAVHTVGFWYSFVKGGVDYHTVAFIHF